MTQIRFLACLISGLMLLAACNKDKSQPPATTTESNPVSTAPASTPPVAETPAPPPPPQPPTPPKPVVIAAGTVLSVHLRDEVGSKTSNAGDRFNASLAKSIRLDEKIVVPEGSRISGRVTEAQCCGSIQGRSNAGLGG